MLKCWDAEPENRYTFSQLEVVLSQGLAVAKREFPPARDVGELVNQKLSSDVRRLSVSASRRANAKSMGKRPQSMLRRPLAPVHSEDAEAADGQRTDAADGTDTQQEQQQQQQDKGQGEQEEEEKGEGRTRMRLRSVSRAAIKRRAQAAAAKGRESDGTAESTQNGRPEEPAHTRGDADAGEVGAMVTMEGELVPEDAPRIDD